MKLILFLILFFNASHLYSEEPGKFSPAKINEKIKEKISTRSRPTYYSMPERKHTWEDNFKIMGMAYAAAWAVYPITQPDTVRNHGSWSHYKHNFGKLVFDHDEPVWNWMIHPLSGSQLFLFFRANGYTKADSLAMSFVISSLFEFTVEIYTEPASIQDLYQTPILGSIVGLGLENLSLSLLNSGNPTLKALGHILNPWTLFWFYEGRVTVLPAYIPNKYRGINIIAEF